MPLLEVRHLSVEFETSRGTLRAVRDVSLSVEPGEILGLVGESGSGKTVTCRAILRLLPGLRARIPTGEILFEGHDIARLPEAEMRKLRGPSMAMIFQNPSSHLDPVMTVGRQIAESIIYHDKCSRREARRRAAMLLAEVGIPDAGSALDAFPHQFSGGMRQRAMMAAALSCRPKLLIADEPTTALDVTVQAQILRLLMRLRDEQGLAIVFITHDLGVVAQLCDTIAVMYAGGVVERGPKRVILRHPLHPYTEGLMRSQPEGRPADEPLASIEGQPPSLEALPPGCPFHPRCRHARDFCSRRDTTLEERERGHWSACLRWDALAAGREPVP